VRDSRVFETLALDLEGDGKKEIIALLPGSTVVVLSATGELQSRLTFKGDRLSIAGGDLDGDGDDELVVGGEGLGVAVIGGARPAP